MAYEMDPLPPTATATPQAKPVKLVNADGTINIESIINIVNKQYSDKKDVNVLLLGDGNYLSWNNNIYSFDNLEQNSDIDEAHKLDGKKNLDAYLKIFKAYAQAFNKNDLTDSELKTTFPTFYEISHDSDFKGMNITEEQALKLITELSKASITEEVMFKTDNKGIANSFKPAEIPGSFANQQYLILNGNDAGGPTAEEVEAAAQFYLKNKEALNALGVTDAIDPDAATVGKGVKTTPTKTVTQGQ